MGWEDVLLGSMLRVTALLPALMSASVQMGGQDNVLKIILKFTSSSSLFPHALAVHGEHLSAQRMMATAASAWDSSGVLWLLWWAADWPCSSKSEFP